VSSIVQASGDKPQAATFDLLIPKIAVKTGSQTVNNSATFVNDSALFLAVDINTTYRCHLHLSYTSGTTPDFKYQFTKPTGATLSAWSFLGYSTTVTFAYGGTGETQSIGGNVTAIPLDAWGILTTSTTAGTFQLQWAQNTATASDTIVQAGSFLELIRVDV
jgi:hypothetical protein